MTSEINDVNELLTQLSEEEITKQNNKLKNNAPMSPNVLLRE